MRKSKSLIAITCILMQVLLLNVAIGAASRENEKKNLSGQVSRISDRLHQVLEQNVKMQRAMTEQSAILSSIQSEHGQAMQQLQDDKRALQGLTHKIDAMADDNRVAEVRNNVATSFNILGMIFGVLGGVLLAGSQLSARQSKIMDIRAKSGFTDLTTTDTAKEMVLNFYGLLGGVAIAIGFVFQFVGALVSAPLHWIAVLLLSMVAGAFVVLVFLYFLRFTPNQTPSQKARIVVDNFHRLILMPAMKFIIHRRLVMCQVCAQSLTSADTSVWWVHEDNSQSHPYLHMPKEFHYGHEACLPKVEKYRVYLNASNLQHQIRRASLQDFLEKEIPRLHEWFAGWHKCWAGKPYSEADAPGEEQYKLVAKDISLLVTK